tara:strand:+ start:693 stop:2936 length:2244 start_codon:yes stop_codon:yes gene_type:complete
MSTKLISSHGLHNNYNNYINNQLGGAKKKTSRNTSRKTSRKNSRKKSSSRSRSRSRSRSSEKAKRKFIRTRSSTNPVTLKPWSRTRKFMEITGQVADLPASKPEVKKELFKLLDETNVILLSGDTGSGKTTQVPKLIWEYLDYSDTIVCTQPLTTTAASIAERVADEMDVNLGQHIGFRFKGSEKVKGGAIAGFPILVYMTEGTFLGDTFKQPTNLLNYGAVVIDEAHARNVNTDILLFYIREMLAMNDVRTKFIIMSATLDKKVFMDYFNDYNIKHMHIPGRTFPVTSKSLRESIYQDVQRFKIYFNLRKMIQTILLDIFKQRTKTNKIKDRKPEDILVFLPSKSWIYRLKDDITSYLEWKEFKNFTVMDLSSDVPIGPERDIRLKPKPGYTKIILSTNIAETGVTVNGLKYVIDTGLAFKKGFDPINRTSTMDLGFISQAEAKQRQGRAGRMQEGTCYRLFTNEEFKNMVTHREPEILRVELDHWLLGFYFQYKNVDNSHELVREVIDNLITSPPKKDVDATVKYFRQLNLLEDIYEKNRISLLGECYHAMTSEFMLTTFFLTALSYEVEPEIVTDITTILELKPDLNSWLKMGKDGLPEEFINKYKNDYGDIFGLYQIYLDYKSDNIPETFKEYLNIALFNQIQERSETMSVGAATGGYCPDLIKPRYSVKKNAYANLVQAIRQTYEKYYTLEKSEIKLRNDRSNLLDFKSIKKTTPLIYLSHIDNLTFGSNPNRSYNNFVNYK